MADRAPEGFLRVEVVAPDGPVFEGDASMVVVPALRGELGILPRHHPLVAQLSIGEMRIQTLGGNWLILSVAEGFMKVQFNKVIVLADAAELGGEIDVSRANAAYDRAKTALAKVKDLGIAQAEDVDVYRETLALQRAKNRLKVAKKA